MVAAANLKNIIDQQSAVLAALKAEHQALESSDLAKENTNLQAELAKLRGEYEQAKQKTVALNEENAALKNALYEQIYNEKVKIVSSTAQKLDIFFRAAITEDKNRLSDLESTVKTRIKKMREILKQNSIAAQDDLYTRLDELSTLLDSRLGEVRAASERFSAAFSPQERAELEAMKSAQISEEQILAVAKKNNLERFVGLNVLNAAGIFLLILGVITVARFTYVLLPDLLKGIMIFALGGVLLVAGEILNRKKPRIFSLGLSAGGVGILYAALATSYFVLHILNMYSALGISVLITAGAFVLANRYNSQIIISFALIGGYLPIFSLGASETMLYGAMIYFVILNLLALLISFRKKWRVSSFIGLFLNMIGVGFICFNFSTAANLTKMILTTLYTMFAFLVYTAIPFSGSVLTNSALKKPDIVLLALNTLFSSLMLFAVFSNFQWQHLYGLLAIAFAIIYLLLGWFTEKKLTGRGVYTRALFYLTGLTFVVLIIPLQFGRAWLSLGWLAEGVLLAAYGILGNNKAFKRSGFIICLLCLAAFILFDLAWSYEPLFPWKYLALTVGSLIILGAYMRQKMMGGRFVSVYKYFALINVWFYFMYILNDKLGETLYTYYHNSQPPLNINYFIWVLTVIVTFILAYTIPRLKLLASRGLRIVAVLMYATGILQLFMINTAYARVNYLEYGSPALSIAVVTLLGLLSVLALRDAMRMIISGLKRGVEWYPLGVSAYIVILLTHILMKQFALPFSSAALSIIYALAALAWIIFGFMRRYVFMRRCGLGLVILALIKLFLLDLYALTQGRQIISYFSLGLTLLAISFVYQYFSKRLELKEVASVDAQETA